MINYLLAVIAIITLAYGIVSLKKNVESYSNFYETSINETKKIIYIRDVFVKLFVNNCMKIIKKFFLLIE